MIEICWYGRGGQGAKTAAQLLAEAALEEGKYVQAFPEYGPERAGAPLRVFTRISEDLINLHCGIVTPQIVVVIDPTLLNQVTETKIKEKGIILVNIDKSPFQIRKKGFSLFLGRIYTVDATKVALDVLGEPLPNTPMLGALVKVTQIVSLKSLESVLRKKFLKKLGEEKVNANIVSLHRAYKEVVGE